MNLANLANLSKSPGMPDSVRIETRRLTNLSSITWQAPKAGKAKGYYLLVRETTSPIWQRKIYTSQTSMTLPLSKDNYFFAVQSVSEDGNESLPVVPSVGR
jgi:hypothetical protein